MLNILLIRHGSTDIMRSILCGRMAGVHLNPAGTQEARTLGRNLAGIRNLRAIYSSPLERALETAAEVAVLHGLDVAPEPELNEIDFGSWMGKSFEEIQEDEAWQSFNRFRSLASPPGGESMLQVQTRAWNALTRMEQEHGDGCVVAVTHGDVIRGVLLFLLGMPIDNIFRLEVAPASVTSISIGNGVSPVVHQMNGTFDRAHA